MANNTIAIPATKLELEQLIEEVFLKYRTKGFPYYSLTPEQKFRKLNNLRNYHHANLIVDGDILQRMHGLSLAWSYFPASWSVRCGSMKTPLDVFNSDQDLRGAIAKHIKYRPEAITDAAIRRVVRFFSGAQGVSNFRPTAAAAVYHTFLPKAGGSVWDMSSGFGGRLLGAIACNHVSRYVGIVDVISDMQDGFLCFRIEVWPAELVPEDFDVELYATPVSGHELYLVKAQRAPDLDHDGVLHYSIQVDSSRPYSDYTVRIVPQHRDLCVPLESGQILWQH